jgi:hypothetical protein
VPNSDSDTRMTALVLEEGLGQRRPSVACLLVSAYELVEMLVSTSSYALVSFESLLNHLKNARCIPLYRSMCRSISATLSTTYQEEFDVSSLYR